MVGDWGPKENTLCCTVGDQEVTLQVKGQGVSQDPALGFYWHEWHEIFVRGPALLDVSFGNQPAERLDDDLARFTYQNQIGRSVIRVQAGGRWLPPLPVEILSPKRPTPAEHLRFYRALVNDLAVRATRLPFVVAAPTGIPARESPRPPSPLFVYHFLRRYHDDLRAALTAVLAEPHRVLAEEETLVPLAQAADVDADVLLSILTQPEYLVPAGEPAALATRLRGHAPTHVWQRLGRETFDTPENRFVRTFLRSLLRWTESLPATAWLWKSVPDPAKDELRDLAGHLRLALTDPLFDEVGEMAVFPAASQVLLRRYGYRELLDLWRLFHLARRPFFDPLQAAIDARDIATLYEFWCFFALADELGRVLSVSPCWQFAVGDARGLEPRSSVVYPGTPYRLCYNQGFGRRTDKSGSYSVPLKPDFTLLHGNRITVAFDAKFRLETSAWASEDDDAPDRQAQRADLYKMHTYRDALGARAAVALYPGGVTEFYDAAAHVRREDVTMETMLAEEWTGVGALPLSPEDNIAQAMGIITRETATEGNESGEMSPVESGMEV